MKKVLCMMLLLAAATTVANAQLIVGNDQTGVATIWNVDPMTGTATALYSNSDGSAKPWGMAYDGATNMLYWNDGSTLYGSPFGATLTPTNLGTMMYNGSTVNFVALGFKDGMLYGTRNISTEAVYEIDPETLNSTLVYQYSSSYDFGGIDFDAVTGTMYGLTDSYPSGGQRGLYEIDVMNQTVTFKAPYPAGETDIDGLAVYDGIAYYVTDGPNTVQQYFYKYDIASGTMLGTIPSPFTGSGVFAAATWVPEPASAVLLALAGLAVLRRR